jgi:hypothetical protein
VAEQQGADPEVGARVRMKATGGTGTIREVVEVHGRKLYCVVYDPIAREEPAPILGETVGEFTVYTAAGGSDVLPQRGGAAFAASGLPRPARPSFIGGKGEPHVDL